MRSAQYDRLSVQVFHTREEMGAAAAKQAVQRLTTVLDRQETATVLFGAAPSQNETLAAFAASDIDFSRIIALHMDEYHTLPVTAPQRFSRYLDEHIFGLVPFKAAHYLGREGSAAADCVRYADILRAHPLDMAFIGIGENGHIAFNDPHEADFNDPKLVREVSLDVQCRMQQVHDGCFATLDDVPTHALTLTIPAIMAAPHLICTVPGPQKCAAVTATCQGPVSTACPASILRTHADCTLFCDAQSGKDI